MSVHSRYVNCGLIIFFLMNATPCYLLLPLISSFVAKVFSSMMPMWQQPCSCLLVLHWLMGGEQMREGVGMGCVGRRELGQLAKSCCQWIAAPSLFPLKRQHNHFLHAIGLVALFPFNCVTVLFCCYYSSDDVKLQLSNWKHSTTMALKC